MIRDFINLSSLSKRINALVYVLAPTTLESKYFLTSRTKPTWPNLFSTFFVNLPQKSTYKVLHQIKLRVIPIIEKIKINSIKCTTYYIIWNMYVNPINHYLIQKKSCRYELVIIDSLKITQWSHFCTKLSVQLYIYVL